MIRHDFYLSFGDEPGLESPRVRTMAIPDGEWVRFDAAQSRIAEQDEYIKAIDVAFAQMNDSCVTLEKRIAELERMVVWCVETGASFVPPRDIVYNELGFGSCVRVVTTDGTPASILAAVEKGMGGGK